MYIYKNGVTLQLRESLFLAILECTRAEFGEQDHEGVSPEFADRILKMVNHYSLMESDQRIDAMVFEMCLSWVGTGKCMFR